MTRTKCNIDSISSSIGTNFLQLDTFFGLGNRRFRDIVVLHKDDYMKAIKIVKPRVARKIVKAIRTGNPPGRFLKKSSKDNKWYDVGPYICFNVTSSKL